MNLKLQTFRIHLDKSFCFSFRLKYFLKPFTFILYTTVHSFMLKLKLRAVPNTPILNEHATKFVDLTSLLKYHHLYKMNHTHKIG